MAKTKACPKTDTGRFLTVACVTVFGTVILYRLCYMLRTAVYYDSSVTDAMFNLIHYICSALQSAAHGLMLATIVCAFFLGEPKCYRRAIFIASGGILLLHLSAFLVDQINGVITDALSTLLLVLITILIELLLETAVTVLILWIGFRKKRALLPVESVFSLKKPPQVAALAVAAVYFLECLYAHVTEIASFFLSDAAVFNSEVAFEIVGRFFEAAMTGFVIPYAMILLFLLFFAPRSEKN